MGGGQQQGEPQNQQASEQQGCAAVVERLAGRFGLLADPNGDQGQQQQGQTRKKPGVFVLEQELGAGGAEQNRGGDQRLEPLPIFRQRRPRTFFAGGGGGRNHAGDQADVDQIETGNREGAWQSGGQGVAGEVDGEKQERKKPGAERSPPPPKFEGQQEVDGDESPVDERDGREIEQPGWRVGEAPGPPAAGDGGSFDGKTHRGHAETRYQTGAVGIGTLAKPPQQAIGEKGGEAHRDGPTEQFLERDPPKGQQWGRQAVRRAAKMGIRQGADRKGTDEAIKTGGSEERQRRAIPQQGAAVVEQ